MIYRYYYKSTPTSCLATIRRLIESGRLRVSEIVTIRVNFSDRKWYRFTIRTSTKQVQFKVVSWFYYGAGTLSLKQVLSWLLVLEPYKDVVLDVHQQGDTYQPNCLVIPISKRRDRYAYLLETECYC